MLKVIDDVCTPTRGTKYSAGVDLKSRVDIKAMCGVTTFIPLGVKIDKDNLSIQDDFVCRKHFLDLKPRSSIRAKGFIVGTGVIDLDYPDEICLILYKPHTVTSIVKSIVSLGKWKTYTEFKRGERIAQLLVKTHFPEFLGIESTKERTGGVGSTGKD